MSDDEVFNGTVRRLKKARRNIYKRSTNELRFVNDILSIINEVIVRYDHAMTNGEFTTSPHLHHLSRILNYMIAAYQNIEKMLAEDGFKFLEDYYKVLNLGGMTPINKKLVSKLGNVGKQHMPKVEVKRRHGNLTLGKKKKKKKRKG